LNAAVTSLNETLTATDSTLSYQWLDCQNGYQAIANETGRSFTPTVNGDYAVEVSNGSCRDTSVCSSITVGINAIQGIKGCIVYPNPVKDRLVIKMAQPEEALVTVMDLSGRIVLTTIITGTLNSIQTDAWGYGVYTVQVAASDRKSVFRVKK